MQELAENLRNSNIKELDLSNNALGCAGIKTLCQHYLADKNCALDKLYLVNTKFKAPGGLTLFSTIGNKCKKLKYLNVSRNMFGSQKMEKVGSSLSIGCLEILDITDCDLGFYGMY